VTLSQHPEEPAQRSTERLLFGAQRDSAQGASRPRVEMDHTSRRVLRRSAERSTPEEAPMAEFPAPKDGMVLTHFIVSDDVGRSRRFYTEVLGGETVREGEPSFVALANSWIIINVGGAPTEDKPTVTLETPPDPDRVSSFLNIRVADIKQIYADWSSRGAQFLTPPQDRGAEIRCYLRDPDGHLIEVGQTSEAFLSQHND
jgi:catechol 2,3-dioxygenase-like lactoylglutathione lyase family enzyme